jgi:dihydropteroate synthase
VSLAPVGLLHPRYPGLRLGARTLVMGILNVTPDSFSGDGLARRDVDAVVARAEELAAAGADVLDVGGESTRPGAETVPEDVELARVLPVVERLAGRVGVPLSIDTRKAAVARAAVEAGAVIVNDVSGLDFDPRMAETVAEAGAALVVGHWQRRPPDDAGDLLEWIAHGLRRSVARATAAGLPRTRLMVDPGLGFAKPPPWSFEVLRRWPELRDMLGLPILIGASRKNHIGRALGGAPVDQRRDGSVAAAAVVAAMGADMVRVHDVKETADAVRVADAIGRGYWDEPPTWTPVYLGLGSNVGDRQAILRDAIDRLGDAAGDDLWPAIRVVRRASLWETAPVGPVAQGPFLNTVVEAETTLTPAALLARVKEVEQRLGRQRRERWGPREIDIDVLLYGDARIGEAGLTVPHPELWNRLFVLAPLAELQPDLRGPDGRGIREHVARLREAQEARCLGW